MAVTINADTSNGLVMTPDTSGEIKLQSAGTDTVTVTSNGNVGVGTSSPTSELHVEDSGGNAVFSLISSNTGGSFLHLGDIDDLNIGKIDYQHSDNSMRFTTNNVERMRIDSGGAVLVGTTSNASSAARMVVSSTAPQMAVNGNGAGVNSLINWTTSGTTKAQTYFDATNTRFYIACNNSGGVYLASGGTSWTAASDERVKDIIEPITDAANKVSTLRTVIGKYKTDEEGTRRSFLIAQDIQAVLPEAVDATDSENLGVQYTDVIPLLVAAIKEQQEQIKALETRIQALESN